MKKIISITLLVMFFGGNISFGQGTCTPACNDITQKCIGGTCTPKTQAEMDQEQCGGNGTYNVSNQSCSISSGSSPTSVMGITCDENSLVNGQCKLNIYDTLGIRQSTRNTGDQTSVGQFVQDVVLSATMFIGTLVTVALIASGLMFIFAASSGKDPANAKKGIVGSLVGLLIVVSSYVIIRLVQYIAKGF